MKKTYLKPITKRVEIVGDTPLLDVTMTINDKTDDEEIEKIEYLLGNSVNVWEEE